MNVVPVAMEPVSTHTSLPPSSLIVCSRNRPTLLAETIESVLRGDEVPSEIIIIDQSAKPHTALAALKPERACVVRYRQSPSVGVSRARNEGIAAAQHDLLSLIDDDMWAASNWFGALMRALMEAGPRSVVCGQVRPSEEPAAGAFVPATKTDMAPAIYTAPGSVDVLYGNHFALYRSTLDDIGPFDERLGPGTIFPGAEDSDWGFRLLRGGYRIIYAPQAVLYHRGWRSKQDYLRLRWNYGLGRGAFYAKYLSRQDPYTARRLISDVRGHLLPLPRQIWRDRARSYGDALLAGGVLWGAVRWLISYGRSRAASAGQLTRSRS